MTPKPMLKFEGEDARIDSRMIKDDRIRQEGERSIFDVKEAPNKLGLCMLGWDRLEHWGNFLL